jgi:NAD dependent epimerase/dehydratase family enzyme
MAIAKKIDRPLFLPNIPAFVLKILLGEMADLVLKGSKLSSRKVTDHGFQFQFDTLDKALEDLYQ